MRIGIGQTEITSLAPVVAASATDSSSGCGFWEYFFGTCEPLASAPTLPAPPAGATDYTPAQLLTTACEQAGGTAEACAAANPSTPNSGTSNTTLLIVAALGIGALILFAAVQK
jgi:hypothetical protein